MNLSEALDAALPEIPRARLTRAHPPRLDPDLIIREDILDGEPIVGVMQRGKSNFFRFEPVQWQLASLFDGIRSYEEIAVLFRENTNSYISPEDVRGFAQSMDASEFWYQTPQEKNIALSEKLAAQRSRKANRRSKVNLAHISFSAWDPDIYLGWLDGKIGGFIYNPWSVTILVALLIFQAVVFIARWDTLGPDILLYYNFAHKSLYDIAEFWFLFLILGFLHETAHGLTCKHFGGQVHSMGLMFLYLTPCFFVDVTEGWVSASRLQRLATIIAGIWVEMTLCSLAMILWMNTQTGERLHNFAYEIILLTGIAVVLINLNPLIKLDGYYFLTEFIGIPDLKERSTAFLSGWFQGRLLRLPVEVPVIPRRRLTLFVLYAFTSGLYSYLLLYAVIRLVYNVGFNFFGEFAILPAGALTYGLFKSRLRSLSRVIRDFWDIHLAAGYRWRPVHFITVAAALVLVFAPIIREHETAMFIVEPAGTADLHAPVSGRVDAVLVREGEKVAAGQPLLRMSSAAADSMSAAAAAQTETAQYRSFEAQLRKQGVGPSKVEQDAGAGSIALADAAASSLLVTAPAAGVVLTEDPASLLRQSVASGQSLLALAQDGPRVARIFVPVSLLPRIPQHARVSLNPAGTFSSVHLRLAPLDGEAFTLPEGLVAHQDYKGIELPTFYCSRVQIPDSDSRLLIGSSGEAVIFGRRRSLFLRAVDAGTNTVRAHIW